MSVVSEIYVLLGLKPNKKEWDNGLKMIKGLKRALTGIAAAAGIRQITRLTESAADAATHIIAMSKSFGISTGAVQEWAYVAKQSGSSIQQFGSAVSQIERNLLSFAHGRGSKDARQAFELFGISQAEAAKSLTEPNGLNEVIFKMADRAKALGNNMLVSGSVMKVAGRYAQGFAADLSQGSEGLRTMIDRLHQVGGVVSDKQLLDLKKFDNTVKTVKASLNALWMKAVAAFGPSLTKMLQDALTWIEKNKDLLRGAFTVALTVVKDTFEAIGATVKWLGDEIHKALGGDKGATAILTGLATVIAGLVVPALWAMVAPIVVALAPLIAIGAEVAAVTYGLLKWGPAIVKGIAHGIAWVRDKLGELWDWLGEQKDRILADLHRDWDEFWAWLEDRASKAVHWIANELEKIPGVKTLVHIGHKIGGALGGDEEAAARAQATSIDSFTVASRTPVAFAGTGAVHNTTTTTTGGQTTISVSAPVTITGVKGAAEAAHEIQDAHERSLRHALATTGGDAR